MSDAHLRARGDDGTHRRDVSYPPLPDPLIVPVYDNHTHMEIADGVGDGGDGPIDYREHLRRAERVGVRGVVQVGTDLETSRWSADLAAREPQVLAAVALHPNEAPILAEQGVLDTHLAGIAQLAGLPRVRAIGETGLDFFRTGPDGRAAQIRSFEEHIRIAKEYDLALTIHDRDAHDDVVDVLQRVGAPAKTVFHCFSGGPELAHVCAEHGWYMSFAGTVTFKNAQNLRDALQVAPRELLMVETDAPFLTPTPYRGRPNAPYLIPLTVRAMAETLDTDLSALSLQLVENTERVYGSWDAVTEVVA